MKELQPIKVMSKQLGLEAHRAVQEKNTLQATNNKQAAKSAAAQKNSKALFEIQKLDEEVGGLKIKAELPEIVRVHTINSSSMLRLARISSTQQNNNDMFWD